MVAVLMVVTGCAAAPGVAESTPTPVVSSFPSPGAASPETSPATTAPSSAAASEPTPTPIANYPPSTTGHGPDPLYGRAEPIPGTPDAAAADALAEARRQLEAGGSYQLWMSIAGDGPAAEGQLAGTIRAGDAAGKFRMLIQVAAIDDPANRVEPPA
jgi:hypothetical protein